MGKRKKINKKISSVRNIIVLFIAVIICLTSYFYDYDILDNNNVNLKETNALVDTSNLEGILKVHFIDVGQADAILIEQAGSAMLIDAGEYETREVVNSYIKDKNISKLDYVVATHPHSDHIGAMSSVIDTFDIGKVIMSKKTHTTNVYKKFLESINNKSVEKIIPQVGDKFELGDAIFEIVGPTYKSDYKDDANNYSIVLKLTFGNNTFLFTGDAETLSEKDMLDSNINLECDLLKVGHHGSDTSTSDSFLKAVNPKYAVISVGKDNSYGLPKSSTINKLSNNSIQVFRTDESGNIIAISDGNSITIEEEKK